MGRVAALEILLPDDAVRNLVRQGKVEQIYSVMQTNTARGMQTMEQSLQELVSRRIVTYETALAVTSKPEQLTGLLERAGFAIPAPVAAAPPLELDGALAGGLRVAGS
jgi:twitching motility protein PilT